MSDSDSDYYDSVCGGPIVLTEEDCVRIDALSTPESVSSTTSSPRLTSNLTISYENMASSLLPATLNGIKTLSPFKRFRPNGRLSVTDLVAPTWCEVQFEYGLQQQRSRKLELRPSKFTTRNGKEITVEQHTAVVNDATLKAGHSVHTALEREIHPDRVVIEVRTQEEFWAKKMFDMLACIQSLMLSGICREFPVVGFVHGQLVAGIIDEVKRFPCSDTGPNPDTSSISSPSPSSSPSLDPQPTPKRRRGRPKKNPDPQSSGSEASIDHSTDRSTVHHHQKSHHRLFLSDSKTRFSFSLPSHSATLASRLQLMLYRNLLNDLISVSSPFNFDRLWRSLGVDPSRTFSDPFMTQIYPLLGDNSTIKCLKDLEQGWNTALTGLDLLEKREDVVLPVHEQLTIVYRLRDKANSFKMGKRRSPSPSPPPQEDIQLQKAILESLRSTKPAITGSENLPSPDIVKITEKIKTAHLAGSNLHENSTANAQAVNGDTEQRDTTPGSIIGQVQFDHDEALLNTHVSKVLDWWYGKREPVGVSIEEANRCNYCEYVSGCEWREKMALRLLTE